LDRHRGSNGNRSATRRTAQAVAADGSGVRETVFNNEKEGDYIIPTLFLVMAFAIAALVVAAIGLYGVVAYGIAKERGSLASASLWARDALTFCGW
jgi:hypothetical protein